MARYPMRYKLPAVLVGLIFAGCFREPDPVKTPVSPFTGVAFIITSDYVEGSYSTIDLTTLRTYNDLGPQMVHSDAFPRHCPFDGRIYVLNRAGRDNIQVLNPVTNFRTDWELSSGERSNPHDIVFISRIKAYVTRYNSSEMWIVDPVAGKKTGEIDLSAYAVPENTGINRNVPNMAKMYLDDNTGLVFIALQRFLDSWHPSDYSSVLVIDPAADAAVREIRLTWETAPGTESAARNPYSDLRPVPAALWQPSTPDGHDHLFVSCTGELGNFEVLDGGIVAIDTEDLEIEDGYILSEEAAGFEIIDFAIKTTDTGYAITSKKESSGKFTTGIVRFNPSKGTVTAVIRENSHDSGQINCLNLHSSGRLFVCDRNAVSPGVRVYDTDDNDRALNEGVPVYVGLPPDSITMVE